MIPRMETGVGGRGDTFERQPSLTLAIVMAGMKIDLLKKPPQPKMIPRLGEGTL